MKQTDGKEESKNPFLEKYTLGKKLGKGHFATVRLCTNNQTKENFAVKIIVKKDLVKNSIEIKDEIEIMRSIGDHPHCLRMHDDMSSDQYHYIVMEICEGGDLFSQIVEEGAYSEDDAARACKQIAQALQHLHKKGVCHRDLKPENILLTEKSLKADLKVADFGLSKLIRGHKHLMKTVCGTWAYCAPEVIAHHPYGVEVDNWTLGVIMFVLLSGYHPFDVYGDIAEPELMAKIENVNYDFNDEGWKVVSDKAKVLISNLLLLDPKKRMTLEEFLASDWIKEHTKAELPTSPNPHMLKRMASLHGQHMRLKSTVRAMIATQKFRHAITPNRSPYHSPHGTPMRTPEVSKQATV